MDSGAGIPLLWPKKSPVALTLTGPDAAVAPVSNVPPGINDLDIDVRRFQRVLFDKGAARFNGVAH